jgi:hypothetical protein
VSSYNAPFVKKDTNTNQSTHENIYNISLFFPETIDYSAKVVALGRCFEPDLALAASEYFTRWSDKLDCSGLYYASCTTTKVAAFDFLSFNYCMNMMYLALLYLA